MRKNVKTKEKYTLAKHNNMKRMKRFLTVMLSVVLSVSVMATTDAFVIPAHTMEAEALCGSVNHTHSEECYDEGINLICGLEEHEHTELCFTGAKQEEQESASDAEATKKSSSKLMAAPGPLRSPAGGDHYSSDLAEFISNVELRDTEGNLIDIRDSNSVVNAGEDYILNIRFDENPDTGNFKQFKYDSEGFLTYDLDATGLNFDYDDSFGGDITIVYQGETKVVGHYNFEIDTATGKHIARVYFEDVDDRGNPTPGQNFIDWVQDAGFSFDIKVNIDSHDADENLNVNLGTSWNVTLKKNRDNNLTVDKVMDGTDVPFDQRYPKYDEKTRSMIYKVVVECTKGSADNISYTDNATVKVQNVEYDITDAGYSNYCDFVITDLDGNEIATGDNFSCLANAAGPVKKGEGYIIYYRMKMDPPGRPDTLQNAAFVDAVVNNHITVNYENPADRLEPCEPIDDNTTNRVTLVNLQKEGSAAGTDSDGNKIINWSVVAGGKGVPLEQPLTLQDTIGAGHSFYADNQPTWELIDPNNTVMESGQFTSENFSVSGNCLTFSLPHNTEYRFRVRYSTITDNANGGSYSNEVEVPEKGWTVTKGVNLAGGVGSMEKEVSGSDDEYVYYTITANIPHSVSPFNFYFSDNLYAESNATRVENRAEAISVQVEYSDAGGNNIIQTLSGYDKETAYDPGDREVRYYVEKTDADTPMARSSWRMMFFRGKPTQLSQHGSYWYFNEHDCVLTISYRIPKSAEVFASDGNPKNIRDQLASGRKLTNQVWFDQTYNDTVVYTEPLPVTKRGRIEEITDGKFLYEVAFTNDVIPLGESNPKNYLPLCENFVNAVFSDSFDDRLEYVPGSLMAFVYKRSDNSQFYYHGSGFGITSPDPGKSPDIQGLFRYGGPDISGNTINAEWKDFAYEKHSTNDYIKGHLFRPWVEHSYLKGGGHDDASLEEFANVLKNTNGVSDTAVVFLYELKLKDEYKIAENLVLENSAHVSFDRPEGGKYISPPAICDVNYDSSLIKKTMEYSGGDVVSYEITINPYGMDLTPDDTMTVKDEMCEFLSPYMATLKVFKGTPGTPEPSWGNEIDPNALYNTENNTISMTLPDDVPLKITYNCMIIGAEEGQPVALDNSVSINGEPQSFYVNKANIMITASSSTGTGTNHFMILRKQDSEGHPLNGAGFALYGSKEANQGVAPSGVAQQIDFNGKTLYYYSMHETADDTENEYFHGVFKIDESNNHLEEKGLFALVEVTPPEGFDIDPEPMGFYWLDKPDDAIEGVDVFKHEKDYEFIDAPEAYSLPMTGSSGGLILGCTAMACMILSGILLLI